MKNKCFIIYNIILFIIFISLILITISGTGNLDITPFAESALLVFGLAGILSQLHIINKALIKKNSPK